MTDHGSAAKTAVLIDEMVAEQAAAHPDAIALRWSDGELTYQEVQASAELFARRLAGARRAAVFNDRSPELVIAVLAVLRTGGAYVPLDYTFPRRRLDYMLSNSGADRLLCWSAHADQITVPAGCRVELLDDIVKGGAQADPLPPATRISPEDPVYVAYTSGSTGWPKGIAMPHRAVANTVSWQLADSRATVGWNTLQLWSLSVDVAFMEIFATWASGGTVVLVSEHTRKDWRRLLTFIDEQQIHRIWLSFTYLYQLIETAHQMELYPASLREVITAGDQPQINDKVREFFARTGGRLQNLYGTTETHVVTANTLSGDPWKWPSRPSIGRAFPNTVVAVVDEHLHPLPVGEQGEICIGGVSVPDGYLNLPEATAARFRPWPEMGTTAYLSGDLGRLLPDGDIEFLGRRDTQVKIGGVRIELEEIEAQLRMLDSVSDALVTAHTDSERPFLAAHCIPAPGCVIDGEQLRQQLAEVLFPRCIPARYYTVAAFPFTPVGKVDRDALARTVPEQ